MSLPQTTSVGGEAYNGISQISLVMQMYVLGPRLILSIRQYNAKVVPVANSEEAITMASITFQVHSQMSTDHGV